VDARNKWTYLRIDVGKKDVNTLEVKSNGLSINGAYTYQWADGKEFYYWPERRLAGEFLPDILNYGYDKYAFDLAGDKWYGPFIHNADNGVPMSEPRPEVIWVQATWNAQAKKFEDITTDVAKPEEQFISVYKISATKSQSNPELITVKSTENPEPTPENPRNMGVPFEASYSPEDYIALEGKMKTKVSSETKKKAAIEADLDDLAEFIYTHEIPKRGARVGGGGGTAGTRRSATSIDDLYATLDRKVAEEKERGNTVKFYMNISGLKFAAKGGGVVGAKYSTTPPLGALTDSAYPDVVFSRKSADSTNSGPVLFYYLAKGGGADGSPNDPAWGPANDEVDIVIKDNVAVPQTVKRGSRGGASRSKSTSSRR
jgi:hypothetical protein